MSNIKSSRRHEHFVVLNDLGEEEELDVNSGALSREACQPSTMGKKMK